MSWNFLVLCLVLTSICWGQTTLPPREKLPQVETNDLGEKCLNVTQWKQVMAVALQNKGLYEWRLEIEPTIFLYQSLEKSYELKLSILQEQVDLLKDDREYLQLRLDQSRKALTQGDKGAKFEKIVMWGVIVIETVVIGVFGIKGAAN